MEEYLDRFRKSREKKIIVDASPWYLYSNCAIKNAYDFNPKAKFIAIVRNPCEMLPSLHRQLLNNYDEDESDLLSAWNLQSQRKQGIKIPVYCRDPKLLQYSETCKFGEQIKVFFNIVPPNQRMVVLFDDLKLDSHSIYKKVLTFIDVEDDGRKDFPVVNESFQWRFQKFSNFVINPPYFIQSFGNYILKYLGFERIGLFLMLYHINNKLNRKKNSKKITSQRLKNIFRDAFSDDIELLGHLLNRDLKRWLN